MLQICTNESYRPSLNQNLGLPKINHYNGVTLSSDLCPIMNASFDVVTMPLLPLVL